MLVPKKEEDSVNKKNQRIIGILIDTKNDITPSKKPNVEKLLLIQKYNREAKIS